MKWSKIKKRFESQLAIVFQNRLHIHITEYTKANFDIGRAWITLDGEEIVGIVIPSFYDNNITFTVETLNFGEAVYQYLSLSIEDAIASEDALIKAFSFLDKRFGKRKLKKVNIEELHPFSVILFSLRCKVEGIKYE